MDGYYAYIVDADWSRPLPHVDLAIESECHDFGDVAAC